ncbi:MAG TPA: 2-hydroxyacid dehydrogenase [Stellaceae bacterium]|nr:2-hydroxyacid dehydrogenase [Stellaceae bacterium]
MPHRILTPNTHGDETMQIAYDMLPPGYELVTAPHGRPEFWDLLKDTDFYIGAGQFKHGPEFYSQAPKLKMVQTLSAGYNTYDLDAALGAGVPICNNGGANATAVAEHAVMLMLAVSRRLIWQHDGVVSGRWRGNDFNSTKLYELEDKTLGIVGLGNIGKKVARRAKAFDLRILYYDVNRMTTDQEDALGVRFALFPELLKTSDIVSLHVPLDKSTHNLIGEKELAMMKKTAILINTCRGPVVDEVALYHALNNEVIMAAGLDVMVEEPPKPDHELFTLKNAIFSPHAAGPTWDNHPKRWRNAFDNCERVARGQRAFWIVPELRDAM